MQRDRLPIAVSIPQYQIPLGSGYRATGNEDEGKGISKGGAGARTPTAPRVNFSDAVRGGAGDAIHTSSATPGPSGGVAGGIASLSMEPGWSSTSGPVFSGHSQTQASSNAPAWATPGFGARPIYGPPPLPHPSPVQRLLAQYVFPDPDPSLPGSPSSNSSVDPFPPPSLSSRKEPQKHKEYDLIGVPLANDNWKERWERMCLVGGGSGGSETNSTFLDPSESASRTPRTSTDGPGKIPKFETRANIDDESYDMILDGEEARSIPAAGLGKQRTGKKLSGRSVPGFAVAAANAAKRKIRERGSSASSVSTSGGGGDFTLSLGYLGEESEPPPCAMTEEDLRRLKEQEKEMAMAVEAEKWRKGDGGGFRRGEVNVTRGEECGLVIAFASNWLELDSPSEGIRFDSELALNQELSYAQHLRINTVVLPPPRNMDCIADYARAIRGCLANWGGLNLAVRLPAISESIPSSAPPSAGTGPRHFSSHSDGVPNSEALPVPGDLGGKSWEVWNTIRTLCGYDGRLGVALDFATHLPSSSYLARWHSEPLRFIMLPAGAFIPNAKGYPVLSRSFQAFLRGVLKFKPTVVLSDTHKGLHVNGGPEAYVLYLRYLERKAPPEDAVEQFAGGYQDYLQAPLQPLMDNLGDDTYEGFERDPVKYRQYEEAVYQALCDRPANRPYVVFICGAGRGPLVVASLRASERSGRQVRLTAVEKNPNAFVILQERQALEWGSSVDLVFSDMRSFAPREKADIIVSELLGSFGDNELSPECLDGVMRCLDDDGVSIPYSYTSYLAPVSTAKLHAEVTSPAFSSFSSSNPGSSESRPAEQPYVVMFSQHHLLSGKGGRKNSDRVQECWSFYHPRDDVVVDERGLPLTNNHNVRSATLTFHIPGAGMCHGFAGYFEATLYNNVGLSIHPERGDREMLSWFPIFFPLKEPLYLPASSEIDVHLYRLTDPENKKVWFEWCAEAFLPIPKTHTPVTPEIALGSQVPSGSTGATTGGEAGGPPGRPAFNPVRPGKDAFSSSTSPVEAEIPSSLPNETIERIKIGMTALHNPGGKACWIGL